MSPDSDPVLSPRQKRGAGNYRRGQRAEKWALWWLRLKGYRLIARRWQSRAGEIDLIMTRGDLLVFIEVKQRQSSSLAAESITSRSRQRITRAAEDFLRRHPHYARHRCRFDALLLSPRKWPQHIPAAWG